MKTFDLEGAAEFLRVSKDSLRDMADSGKVPAAKIGPHAGYRWVFTDEGLEEYLRDEIRKQTAVRRGEKLEMTRLYENSPTPGRYPSGRRKPMTPPPLR